MPQSLRSHRKPGPAQTPTGVRNRLLGLIDGRTLMGLTTAAAITVLLATTVVGAVLVAGGMVVSYAYARRKNIQQHSA